MQISGGVFLLLVPQIGAISSFSSIYIYDDHFLLFIKLSISIGRPEVMDRAVLRPGRFGKLLYVPLPSPDERGLILKALARKKPIDASVDLIAIGQKEACNNLSGADLSALVCPLLPRSLALGLNWPFFYVYIFRCLWQLGDSSLLLVWMWLGFI